MRFDGNNEMVPANAAENDAIGIALTDGDATVHAKQPTAKHPIRLLNDHGTEMLRAAAAFPAKSVVYQADGGKIDDAGTIRRGVTLDESTGDNALVEVLLQ